MTLRRWALDPAFWVGFGSAVPRAPLSKIGVTGVVALAVLASCRPDDLGGACATDDDCPSNQECVIDVKRAAAADAGTGDVGNVYVSYCSSTCQTDDDCPAWQACVAPTTTTCTAECADDDGSDACLFCLKSQQALCTDRVRRCAADDPQNGLDDDCDGVIDGSGGPVIEGCLDDEPCGVFVCQAPEAAADTLCSAQVAPLSTLRGYADCAADADCANGLCHAGFCSPMCRPAVLGGGGCDPYVDETGGQLGTVCARSVESGRPEHNLCQLSCDPGACPSGTECVWRDVVGTSVPLHYFVCSELEPELLPLGDACPSFQQSEQCQHGLCFDFRCTRRCSPPEDCSDIGADFTCQPITLGYDSQSFEVYICAEDQS